MTLYGAKHCRRNTAVPVASEHVHRSGHTAQVGRGLDEVADDDTDEARAAEPGPERLSALGSVSPPNSRMASNNARPDTIASLDDKYTTANIIGIVTGAIQSIP